ncbi:hypothetical protein AALO_G00008180 [Alosa alosa]|uniref:Immunoglobulin V-set domain-containing protein n=1 Tax=Alosa alosa TaxID=278164 RepID=A0AAV6HER4_9TELE|nr:SLAM family member 7-like [Alosa alosa]XP_048114417.1 SLAM family member 7-like [Alosa alosa]KAG5285848.1 hypothetical protein AALO_G00008180 [Alosa alosa]
MSVTVVLLFLVYTLQTAGSPVYKPTGGSVTLEFQQHQPLKMGSIDFIRWHFGQNNIMKYVPRKDTVVVTYKGGYRHRVEFNNETFSLELKNLQKNDSGLYSGELSAGETDIKVEHELSVLDPVEAPVLSVVYNQSCGDFFNVTVTCRGHDLSLTSTCNNINCTPERETSTDSNLTLSFKDNSITCNHRNPVSSKTAKMEFTQCPDKKSPSQQNGALHLSISVCLSVYVPVVSVMLLVNV